MFGTTNNNQLGITLLRLMGELNLKLINLNNTQTFGENRFARYSQKRRRHLTTLFGTLT